MQNIDFAGLILLVACGFFIGMLFQLYRERLKAGKSYGIVLSICIVIGIGTVGILYAIWKIS